MKIKKAAAAMLSLCILGSAVYSLPARTEYALTAGAAESGSCGENCTWTYDEAAKVLTVSGTGDMQSCKDASPWSAWQKEITAVAVEEGVTGIGDSAFYGCTALKSVTVPESVTHIDRLAFQGCSGLTEIVLPDGVTEIGNYAFYGCSGLTAFTVPAGVTGIGVNAFAFCSKLAEITLPAAVVSVGSCAFIDCSSMKTITVLNPECAIDYSEFVRMVPKTTVIRGYSGSTAQAYAEFFGQTFEVIEASVPVAGDFSGDGTVTAADAVLLARFAAEDDTLTGEQLAGIGSCEPDLNSDGIVNLLDACALLENLASESPEKGA